MLDGTKRSRLVLSTLGLRANLQVRESFGVDGVGITLEDVPEAEIDEVEINEDESDACEADAAELLDAVLALPNRSIELVLDDTVELLLSTVEEVLLLSVVGDETEDVTEDVVDVTDLDELADVELNAAADDCELVRTELEVCEDMELDDRSTYELEELCAADELLEILLDICEELADKTRVELLEVCGTDELLEAVLELLEELLAVVVIPRHVPKAAWQPALQ